MKQTLHPLHPLQPLRAAALALALALVGAAAAPARAQLSVSIGIELPVRPRLAQVPGYPVYYAPQVDSNYFYYGGRYWVYAGDGWYAGRGYNGPWQRLGPGQVPLPLLQVPVRYYRAPPRAFEGWRPDEAPRWGEHGSPRWAGPHPGGEGRGGRARPAPDEQAAWHGGDPQGERQRNARQDPQRGAPRDPRGDIRGNPRGQDGDDRPGDHAHATDPQHGNLGNAGHGGDSGSSNDRHRDGGPGGEGH